MRYGVFHFPEDRTGVIERENNLSGYFCIITSEKMTAKQAISLYKSRDASEKLFRGDKSYLGDKSLRAGALGATYYLYKRTSKRVPEKKYPQPVDTYIGIITPEGVVESKKQKLATTSVEVKEYGFSKADPLHEAMFCYAFTEWVTEMLDTKGIKIAIDGKALRGGAEKIKGGKIPYILNAIDVMTGIMKTLYFFHGIDYNYR